MTFDFRALRTTITSLLCGYSFLYHSLIIQYASLALLLSTTCLSNSYIRIKASIQGLKYNKRRQKTMTWCPEKSLNLIKKVQIPEDEPPAGRAHPIPLWLVAPCDCIELSSILLLLHQSLCSNWQVTRLWGTLMPSSPSDAHSSPSAQPKRIQGALMRWGP